MEEIELDTFNESNAIERMMEEETNFFDNAFEDFEDFEDFDLLDDDFDDDFEDNLDNFEDYQDGGIDQEPTDIDNRSKNNDTPQNRRKQMLTAERRKIAKNRKTFFRNKFNQEVVMRDGPASKKLIDKSLISVSKKTGKIDGILYNDTRVVVKKGKGFVLSSNEKIKNTVQEYSDIMEKARQEHSETANGSIEEIVGDLPGTPNVNGIRANIIDRIQDEITISNNTIDRTQLNDEELRELGGILATKNIENLDAVEIADKYWNDKAEAEVDSRKKTVYKDISDVAKLKAEELRLKNNLKPVSEKTDEMIKEDDITKFEKFKKYAKENLGSIAAIAIAIAGIITTVVIAGRKGITSAAKATGAIAKALAKLAKAALPVIAPLVNILATALTWGAKGMAWLAKNLWMLAIALAYILYKNRKKFLP